MKKALTVLLGIIFTLLLVAQESEKTKEVGLTFYSLSNFGMTFKYGTETSLWRLNSLLINGSNQNYDLDSSSRNRNSLSFDIKFGKEFRKGIKDNFEFKYGFDIALRYSKNKNETDDNSVGSFDRFYKSLLFEPGINAIIGFDCLIKDNLVLGAEYLPGINYVFGYNSRTRFDGDEPYEVKEDISGIRYGLQSGAALISLSYRF